MRMVVSTAGKHPLEMLFSAFSATAAMCYQTGGCYGRVGEKCGKARRTLSVEVGNHGTGSRT